MKRSRESQDRVEPDVPSARVPEPFLYGAVEPFSRSGVAPSLTPALVDVLQRAAGNRAVQRAMTARRPGVEGARPWRNAEHRLPSRARSCAAGSALGQSRLPVQRGCGGKDKPKADPKGQAKMIIQSGNLTKEHEARAVQLIDDPNLLLQGAFGICGLVSILRHVLVNDPERFATLTVRALADRANTNDRLPAFKRRATDEQKDDNADLEYLVSHWLIRHGATGQVSQTVLGAGHKTKKSKDYGDVFNKQKQFSDTFKMHGWEDDGHFAMTAGGLNYLLGEHNAGRKSTKINVTNVYDDYKKARSLVGAGGSVIAAVTDTQFYQQGNALVTTAAKPTGGPKYRHWVNLERVEDTGSHLAIHLWTWGGTYDAKLQKNVANSYIYSLVAAEGKKK